MVDWIYQKRDQARVFDYTLYPGEHAYDEEKLRLNQDHLDVVGDRNSKVHNLSS